MGECVGQHFGLTKPTTTVPLASPGHAACADWSQWQGAYPNTTGLRCVIIQASFGDSVEPTVYSQINDANAHHIPWGAYGFMEGGWGGGEADLAVKVTNGRGRSLGVWADAEIGPAYSHACGFVSQVKADGVHIYGLFAAPGMYPAGDGPCVGWLWPSEWNLAGPYSFAGYPFSRILLWQHCGTCFRYGVETDLDSDYGLIALGHPAPKPTRPQLEAELRTHEALKAQLEAQIVHLRHKLAKFGCYPALKAHRAGPKCRGWKAAGNRVHAHVRLEEQFIARLKAELAD